MWHEFWPLLADWKPWKPAVRRACNKQMLQEKLAWEVKSYHTNIVRELEIFGGEVCCDEDVIVENVASFRCNTCTHCFPSYQQLALHAFRQHGVVAQERYYVQSTVCPGCLKDHHTTFRVTQHLRYRRNGCWDRTFLARLPDDPVNIDLPEHLRKVKRLPAIRRHHGPLRPTSVQRLRIQLRQDITALRAEGKPEYAWWYPQDDDPIVQRANVALCDALHTWTRMEHPTEVDFQNLMFGALFTLEIEDPQRCRLFMHWVETHMYDDCPPDMDPDLAILLEQAYVSMLEDLPTWQIRQRMKVLTDRWMHLPSDYPDFGPDRAHCIPSEYQLMAQSEKKRQRWTFHTRPIMRPASQDGPYYIVHLYSGRRRDQDFQFDGEVPRQAPSEAPRMHLCHFDRHGHPPHYEHPQPSTLESLAGLCQGRATDCTSPWPPVRDVVSSEVPLAARRRTPRASTIEDCRRIVGPAAPLSVGTFAAQCGKLPTFERHLAVAVTFHSGSAALEHPAMPYDEELPFIWRSGILRLLLRGGVPFRRVTIQQWRFGAEGVKPTMLLYSNGSLPSALERCELSDITKPTVPLLERDAVGRFKTSKAKEYPSALSRAFALCFSDRMAQLNINSSPKEADPDFFDFVALASCLEGGGMMPDYQPI